MIDKLELFIVLAREQHFGRAAEACGITQPTLSAGLRQLEATLGVLLVQRGSRFQGLTPEGERVLEWARRIVGDARAMRQDVLSMQQELTGHLRIAAIPTALAIMPELTTPFRERHPGVRFTILSCTSQEVLDLLENLEVDAGLTYLDNEPLGRVRSVPLYRERYVLLTSGESPLAHQERVTWAEVAEVPLCLLTPDMQNRRIIDRLLALAPRGNTPMLESNSMIVLVAHVRAGHWSSIVPEPLARILGLGEGMRAIPITAPDALHTVGLIVPHRDPNTPLVAALAQEAKGLAKVLTG